MELADHIAAVFVLLAALYPIANARRFRDRLARVGAEPDDRVKIYWTLMGWLWGMSAIVCGLWLYQGYDFASLGFRYEHTWRFWLTSSAVLLIALFYAAYCIRLRSDPELRQRTRASLEMTQTDQLIPRNRREFRTWVCLSVSAGSEEIVYRGFLLWYLAAFTNLVMAGAVSTVLFAVGHSYQGTTGVVRTGMVGVVFLIVYWISNSLWPAIALHVLQDVFGGAAGYLSHTVPRSDCSE